MIIQEAIDHLSYELEIEVKKGNFEAIKGYIQMAIVVGLEQPLVSHKKRIQMLDKGGNIINKFVRVIDAAQFVKKYKKLKSDIKVIKVQIWRTLTHKLNTCYGYHWKYE